MVLYPILVTTFFFYISGGFLAGFHPSTVVLVTVQLKTVDNGYLGRLGCQINGSFMMDSMDMYLSDIILP